MRNLMQTALLSAALLAVFAAPGYAAVTVGQTFVPQATAPCNGPPRTLFQTTSPGNQYLVPSNGVITAWSHQTNASPPTLRLKVGRFVSGNIYRVVGHSELKTPPANTLTTFTDVRIPVLSGDVIGLAHTTTGGCGASTEPEGSYGFHHVPADPPPGDERPYPSVGVNPGAHLDISARLEADTDNDGFGDETQDQCPTNATTQGQCPVTLDTTAPQTTIKSGPLKTDKAKVKFGFESSEAGSTLQCRLKGKGVTKIEDKQFGACTSPKKYKGLDPGKYKFFVFATDAAGNADMTPVKQKFRIVEEL